MESCAFFDGVPNYGQEHFNRYFKNLFYNGISVSDAGIMELPVTVSGDSLILGAGFAIINGFSYNNDSDREITVEADSSFERIDRVVIRLDLPQKKVYSAVITGVPGSEPKPPAITRNGVIYELSLAQVRVKPSGNRTVTDERSNVQLCGALRPRNMTEFEAMIREYQRRFEEWFASQQGKGWRNIYAQQSTPDGAVEGSIWMEQISVLT